LSFDVSSPPAVPDIKSKDLTPIFAVNLAAAKVKEELSDGHKDQRQGTSTPPDPWAILVEELRAEIRRLEEEENRWLRSRLEERLALPTPQRKWWRWWRRS